MQPTACRNPQSLCPHKLYDRLSLACGLFMLLLVLNTVWDYGIAWDEWFRWQGGERKLEYYQALATGDFTRAAALREVSDSYPGLFDLTNAALRRLSPFGMAETSHLWTALFGLFGLGGTWVLARQLGGPAAAFWALLFLLLSPRYLGHMFFNPKDIPFAATYVWGLAALVWALKRPPRPRPAMGVGFAAGLCMATRIGGLLLLCYAALFSALQGLLHWGKSGFSAAILWAEVRQRFFWLLTAATTALAVLLPWWPHAHRNPLGATTDAVAQVSDFGWRGTVLFFGREIPAAEAPWYYLPAWLGITLPEWQLVLLALALFYALGNVVLSIRQGIEGWTHSRMAYALVAFAALFPLGYIMIRGSTVYDGMRHVLFLLPLLACACACAWTRLLGCAAERSKYWRGTLMLALVLPMLSTAWTMYRLHPYQYIHFNSFAGGPARAYGQFDLDYWGTAYREAAHELQLFLESTEPDWREHTWTVATTPPLQALFARSEIAVVPPPILIEYYLPENLILIEGDQNPDFYVAMTRFGYPGMMDGKIIAVVSRMGAPLAYIRDRR